MKLAILTLLVTLFLNSATSGFSNYLRTNRYQDETEDESQPQIWALIVAGSSGWYNYRHQADVCHAYHILRNHGVSEKRIVTMMYDDIANDRDNPYKGKLFNRPNGSDVYQGVKIDYRGEDVTSENFLAILQGNSSAVKGGNGKVINSTSKDHIFVFFADHGAFGMVAFPETILTMEDLNLALRHMSKMKQYSKLVFYLEACESGSMFKKVLSKHINVYAVTASNSHESSWGCYCDTEDLPCLGDLFSVSWMEDSDDEDIRVETLQKQFTIVKNLTNLSHVMHYGDLSIGNETVAEFQGWKNIPKGEISTDRIENEQTEVPHSFWPSRDISLLTLQKALKKAEHPEKKELIKKKLYEFERKREYLDDFMNALVENIIQDSDNQQRILNNRPYFIANQQCHDTVVKAFNRVCFNLGKNPYALKYIYLFANICEEEIETEVIVQKLVDYCKVIEFDEIH